jgi:hypothetical protein
VKHRSEGLYVSSLTLVTSQWPRGLRPRSAAAWLLGSRVRILLGTCTFVSYVYMLFSCVGRGLCDGLITRPEESHRVSNCVITETAKGALHSKLGT